MWTQKVSLFCVFKTGQGGHTPVSYAVFRMGPAGEIWIDAKTLGNPTDTFTSALTLV